ncbi:MAG: Fe-S protein assembly co-chaperone HscB [Vicinamibacterales bacterium]
MTLKSIPVRSVSTLECGNCGAGAPVDEHFCRQCSRILALGRHGDYFTFFGLPRLLAIDPRDLERRFRQLSRQFHPDFFHNATSSERLASLERSSYLNDAYRVLRSLPARVEYLLSLEGLPPMHTITPGSMQVPASLLEEVFALNEELDEIREMRTSGADGAAVEARLAAARTPIERKRERHELRLEELVAQWDALDAGTTPDARRATLNALREQMLERNYITNLISTIEQQRQQGEARG